MPRGHGEQTPEQSCILAFQVTQQSLSECAQMLLIIQHLKAVNSVGNPSVVEVTVQCARRCAMNLCVNAPVSCRQYLDPSMLPIPTSLLVCSGSKPTKQK